MSDFTPLASHILNAYCARACFVCKLFGPCKHREYSVEEAYILAELAGPTRLVELPLRKPIQRTRVIREKRRTA